MVDSEPQLKQHLSQCARTLILELLRGDPTAPFLAAHISPDFTATSDLTGNAMSLNEYLALAREVQARQPSYNLEILQESVDANLGPDRTHATVWQFASVTGAPEGVARQGLILSRWRWERGEWWCYHVSRYRTEGGVAALVELPGGGGGEDE